MIENNSVNGYEAINASKPEIINFKTKLETITKHLNFRVSSQKINPTTSIKYLGLNNSLTWGIYFKNLQTKLNRAIGLLFKVRHYTPKSPLKTIYFSPFNSHLIYSCQLWEHCKTFLQKENISRDGKITRQSNPYNQLLIKRGKRERGPQHTQNT